jgi:hypothetical protein
MPFFSSRFDFGSVCDMSIGGIRVPLVLEAALMWNSDYLDGRGDLGHVQKWPSDTKKH